MEEITKNGFLTLTAYGKREFKGTLFVELPPLCQVSQKEILTFEEEQKIYIKPVYNKREHITGSL